MIITFDDIKKNIKCIRDTVSYDNTHTNHLQFNSSILNDLMAKLFTSFIIHGHVPVGMIRVIINPLIKDRLGDCHSSSNYRPIIVPSVCLKLFEYCLLSKMEPFIKLNNNNMVFGSNIPHLLLALF